MGYSKLIQYGTYIEIYQYDKDVVRKETPRGPNRRLQDRGVVSVGGFSEQGADEYAAKRKDHARRSRMAFLRLVKANLGGFENPTFVTVTYKHNQKSIVDGYADFRLLIQRLRNRHGKVFKYIAVPEFQKRGAVHFHALFWGIPRVGFGEERTYPKNSVDCVAWGKGYFFVKNSDGKERLAGYLAKYMAKAFLDHRMGGQKAYTCSRNFIRPQIDSGNLDLSYVLDEIVGVDNQPLQKKEYDTQYLGKGRFRLYQLNTQTLCE